jgi:hypothetical protein
MNASLLCFSNPVQIGFMALEIACDGIGKDLEGGFGVLPVFAYVGVEKSGR